jgi:hypothetical protein
VFVFLFSVFHVCISAFKAYSFKERQALLTENSYVEVNVTGDIDLAGVYLFKSGSSIQEIIRSLNLKEKNKFYKNDNKLKIFSNIHLEVNDSGVFLNRSEEFR